MASSIEIEIVANFKDNATTKVKSLNSELDKLEKHNVEILAKADGSAATQTIDEINQKADAAADGVTTKTIAADTSSATEAIDSLQNKIADMENSTIQVNADVAVNGSAADNINWNKVALSDASGTYASFNDASPIVRTMEQIEKNTSAVSSRAVGTGSQYVGYDQSAIEYIDELEYLRGAANEYGIKYDRSADLNTMRNLVWGYEDQAFTGGGQNTAIAAAEAAEDAAETALTGTGNYMSASLAQFGTRMATRMFGFRAMYSSFQKIGEDFSAMSDSDNKNDSTRYLARGLTKGGMMAAGAAIGTVIPGVGTIIGAGAGGLLSQIFGDDLADSISGITKSAEELKAERLDEIFGNIAMSAEDLSAVATNAFGGWETQVREAHSSAISAGYTAQETASASYLDVLEAGGKIDIKNNLGITPTEEESSAYKTLAEGYMDDVETALTQEVYNAFMTNDDVFGYGNWDADALSEQYRTAFESFNTQKDELTKYLEIANSDSNITTDESLHIAEVISSMRELLGDATPDEGEVKTNTYDFLMQSGLMSSDSYSSYLSELGSNFETSVYDLASSRSQQIALGSSTTEADEKFYQDYSTQAETYLQSISDGTRQTFADDYNAALETAVNGTAFNGGLNTFDFLMNGISTGVRSGQSVYKDVQDMFDTVDPENQAALSSTYESVLPTVQAIENQAVKASQEGRDTSQYLDDLMSVYQIGALGGDQDAQEKYSAMMMLSNENFLQSVTDYFGGNYEKISKGYNENFADVWQLMTGGSSEAIQEQAVEYQKAVETEPAQPQAGPSPDYEPTAEITKETAEDSTEKASEGAYELKYSLFDKIAEAMNDDSDIELSSDMGETVLNAVSESLSNVDSDAFEDINLGETIMGSIEDSLSADNMDFKELGFGSTLMSAISESLSAENMDTSSLDIGERIVQSINASLEGVDFSGTVGTISSQLGEMTETPFELKLSAVDEASPLVTAAQTAADTFGETDATTQLDASDAASGVISSVSLALANLDGKTATVTINVKQNGTLPSNNFAQGTMNAPEGLAYVNDDGTSEPWELIEHNGEYIMYEGRNALAMLGAGDRVYTSSQTKAILSGESIPRYAGGLNNEVIESNTLGGSAASISIGGITVSITVDGANGSIVEEIKAHSTEIAEVITDELERHLSAAYANVSASGG